MQGRILGLLLMEYLILIFLNPFIVAIFRHEYLPKTLLVALRRVLCLPLFLPWADFTSLGAMEWFV